MFPPSARAALNSVQFKGVYQRVPNITSSSDAVYYGWNDDGADTLAIQSSYIQCNLITNGDNCGCFGEDPYNPGQCNTGDFTTFSAIKQYSTAYNGNLSTGWYHTSGNLKNTGWKYIVNFNWNLIQNSSVDYCSQDCTAGGTGSANYWADVFAGDAGGLTRSIGIKYDNTMWSWGTGSTAFGYNTWQGRNTTTAASSPTQIGTLSTWKVIVDDEDGSSAFALKTDNTLWGWGLNGSGQLGDGTTTNRSSPVQIGTLSTWATVSNSNQSGAGNPVTCAIKLDGTLWCWGNGAQGKIGDGTVTNRSSPVQVGTLSTWKKVSAGEGHVMAIKTDGTLWAWGSNLTGNIGDGTVTNRSSPVQVGTLSTWLNINASYYASYAIKTDGTLWGWGYGYAYGGYTGGLTYRSSPVQLVTSITNFVNFLGPSNVIGNGSCAARADKKNITCGVYFQATGSTYVTANGPYFEVSDEFFKSKVRNVYDNQQFNLLKTGPG